MNIGHWMVCCVLASNLQLYMPDAYLVIFHHAMKHERIMRKLVLSCAWTHFFFFLTVVGVQHGRIRKFPLVGFVT